MIRSRQGFGKVKGNLSSGNMKTFLGGKFHIAAPDFVSENLGKEIK